jgi:hypothetical protein
MDIKKRIQELSLEDQAKLYYMGLVRQGKIDRLPDNPKDEFLRQMTKDAMEKDRMKAAFEKPQYSDTDDYGRSVSGKDKRTFIEPEDLMPAARARKLSGMEDDDMETRYDYDDPMFEVKFKKGDTVIPNVGPHKGVKHKIIADLGNGKYNIQPIGLKSSEIQYRLGAAGASEDQLKKINNLSEIATELGYLNEYGEYKSQEEKFKQELDLMFKDYRPFISLGKYAGERPDSDPLKGKGFGSIEFVVPTELPPNEFKRALDWAESKGFEIKSQSNEYEVEFDRDRSYYPKIKFHFDVNTFDTE